ncbi:zinc finger and SCAN domain-containing protein 5B-like, partial [Adelges cooleyi]|uniref:zinc finger and SCAN domain-containing protein 5B-like n=1 Tax=Adelges cooleyi TaxID=133065 RepID=UPI00217FB686
MKIKSTSVRKPNTVDVVIQEIDEIDNDFYFKSEIELEESQDLAVIKDEHVHPHYTDNDNTLISNMKYIPIQTDENPSRSIKKCIIKHTAEKPFHCELGLKSFSSVDLNKHIRPHTGERPLQREICKKTFSHLGSLNKHKRTHTGEKPFQCEICKKTYSASGTLKNHIKTHTGERPFQ